MLNSLRFWLGSSEKSSTKRPDRRSRPLRVEELEVRETPSITAAPAGANLTTSVWTEQGSAPLINSQTGTANTTRPATGATNSVLVNPFNPNIAYVGTVAGGIWRSMNFNNGNPDAVTWEKINDRLPSLYITEMVFDPSDRTGNTIYVGTGSTSALRTDYPELNQGIYRITNANAPLVANVQVVQLNNGLPQSIVETLAVSTRNPNAILVGTQNGLFRSLDRGASFQRVVASGLPATVGFVSDILADPNRPLTFYVALPAGRGSGAGGVFRTDDAGLTFTQIDANTPGITKPIVNIGNTRVLLEAHNKGSSIVLYAANLSGGVVGSIFRYEENGTDDNGNGIIDDAGETAWFRMGTPTPVLRGQGDIHFAMAADPRNRNVIYIGGDAADNTLGFIGVGTYTGAVNGVPTSDTATWTQSTPGGTQPHADSRDMFILTPANPNTPVSLIEVSDGGIYRLDNPANPSGGGSQRWFSVTGNLAVAEFQSGAYDTRRNLAFAGAQDNGSQIQTSNGSQRWSLVQGGDGAEQEYSIPGDIRYSLGNNFALLRRYMNGAMSGGQQLVLASPGGTTFASGLETASGAGADQQYVGGYEGTYPIRANRFLAPNMMMARRALYESTNMGDTLDTVIPAAGLNGEKIAFDTFQTIVYGGARNGVPLSQIFYAGTSFGRIYFRDLDNTGNGTRIFDRTASLNAAVPASAAGDTVRKIVVDPADYRRVYVLKGQRVLFSADAGVTWTSLTGNLSTLIPQARSMELLFANPDNPLANRTLVVGGLGGVIGLQLPAGTPFPTNPQWTVFGGLLPNTVFEELDYYASADQDNNAANGRGVLVATSLGRGTFILPNAANFVTPVTLTVTGDAGNNTFRIFSSPTNPTLITVDDGLGNTVSIDRSRLLGVNFVGLGGNDTFLVGTSSTGLTGSLGALTFPITIDGGGQPGDTVILSDSRNTANTTTTVLGGTINRGAGDNLLPQGGSLTLSGIATLGLTTGSGNDTINVTNPTFNLSLATGDGDDAVSLFGSTFTPIMVVEGGSGNNTLAAPNLDDNLFEIASGSAGRLNGVVQFSNFRNIVGGNGRDNAYYTGSQGSEDVLLTLTAAALSGTFNGLGTPASTYAGIESVIFDGLGGVNNFQIADGVPRTLGTALNPEAGLNYAPRSATGGSVSSATAGVGTVNFSNITGTFSMTGGSAQDVLNIVGTSSVAAAGAGSGGELVAQNGSDTVVINDTFVSFSNAVLGQLLAVTILPGGGASTFSTVSVRTGRELGNQGDNIIANTSAIKNLLIDGQGGLDRLTVNGAEPLSSTPINDPTLGPPQTRVVASDGSSLGYLNILSVNAGAATTSNAIYAVAADAGGLPLVRIYSGSTGAIVTQFLAYEPGYSGGVKVAIGDVNGDGVADIITGTGAGSSPHVKVFDGRTYQEIMSFFAYDPSVATGVNVAAGDVDGDGFADVITGVATGMPSHVKAFSGRSGEEIRSFFAYDPSQQTGVSVAAGDFNGDGMADIVTGAGPGGGPHVKVFDGRTGEVLRSFFAFDPTFSGGVLVATGKLNGDGVPDIVVGPAVSSVPVVAVFDGATQAPIVSFFVNSTFSPNSFSSTPVQQGVRVATVDLDGDGQSEILVGKGGIGELPQVFLYRLNPLAPAGDFLAFDGVFSGGLFVAGS